MKSILFKIIRLFSILIPTSKNSILIIHSGNSGSNINPLIEGLNNKYNVSVIKRKDGKKLSSIWRNLRSQLIITTHGDLNFNLKTMVFNLWHGMPMKTMGKMYQNEDRNHYDKYTTYFLSTSEFYNTALNSCISIKGNKYKILGYPRNDYLFNSYENVKLNELFNNSNSKKIIYMPTFREGNNMLNNLFNMEKFDSNRFDVFLRKQNIMLYLKVHPNEEKEAIKNIKQFNMENVKIIETKILNKNNIDLYELINSFDLLITDYSSIYFDYLLLNRPIIFTPTDIENYRKNRGFLYEPYDFWTPGPKAIDQETLEKEIINSLEKESYYNEKRNDIKNIIHKYQDGNSAQRVLNFIDEIMNN